MCTNATARRAPKRCISYIFAMGMVPHLSPVTSHLTPHATQGHLRRASIPRPPILSHTHIACRRMHFHTLAHVLTAYVRSRAHTHVSIYLCPFVYVHIFVQKAVEVFALISAFKQLGYRSAPHPDLSSHIAAGYLHCSHCIAQYLIHSIEASHDCLHWLEGHQGVQYHTARHLAAHLFGQRLSHPTPTSLRSGVYVRKGHAHPPHIDGGEEVEGCHRAEVVIYV
mmetsp:Transcript_49754/g.128004  ORF Transcript_49754/g.128004 Transcript_49754/m.128004 type:complete len:224 (-) Transcript_49754:132-803(-)